VRGITDQRHPILNITQGMLAAEGKTATIGNGLDLTETVGESFQELSEQLLILKSLQAVDLLWRVVPNQRGMRSGERQ
jgi:hypothetical protein